MGEDDVKGAADRAKGAIKHTAAKVRGEKELQEEGKFDKALGSSHNDTVDMRDVAQKAAEKSQ